MECRANKCEKSAHHDQKQSFVHGPWLEHRRRRRRREGSPGVPFSATPTLCCSCSFANESLPLFLARQPRAWTTKLKGPCFGFRGAECALVLCWGSSLSSSSSSSLFCSSVQTTIRERDSWPGGVSGNSQTQLVPPPLFCHSATRHSRLCIFLARKKLPGARKPRGQRASVARALSSRHRLLVDFPKIRPTIECASRVLELPHCMAHSHTVTWILYKVFLSFSLPLRAHR